MNRVETKDGTSIFYKDWGNGQPILFSHGWPLSSDDWDAQLLFFTQQGYRTIAHDRRGHGRSSQVSTGHDMDHYADDLAAVIDALELKDVVLVGHSTGGGEITRYMARHGTKKVAKAVLISSVPPLMLKTAGNPGGVPEAVFDGFRAAVAEDRSQCYLDTTMPFYGYNRPGAKISEGARQHFWLQGMAGSIKAHYEGIKAFSETDFTQDLKGIDVPTLVMHGEDDQIVPFANSGKLSAQIVRNAKLISYPGFPHGMCTTQSARINEDLLAFIKS
jgi:non-heme chloroperoxidase